MMLQEDSEFICITSWDEKLYQKALSWVDEKRRVAILSDQERKTEDPRVQIYHLESPLQLKMMARKIAWSAVFKRLQIVGEGSFQKELEECHLAAGAILSDAADYWVKVLQNARLNSLPYRRGLALKGAFSNIPAVIVGAGPSLEKNGHLLKEFQDKALIFAGGAALHSIDVEPHFAASIDPIAPFREFKRNPFFEAPFFYQSRMNRQNYSLIHGERILFPDNGCEAINWIYGEEEFDGGWTVGNFLTKVAMILGCSPIFFIGMDFCYEKGRKYAKMDAEMPDGLIQVGDFLTQKDWLLAARWTEEQKGKMFDLSSGMLSLPKLQGEEALKMCKSQTDLQEKVHHAIQKLPIQNKNRWDEWDRSLQRCKKLKDLDGEIFYQKLLKPLWEIWKPIFEREDQILELHQKLFFQKVLEEHETSVLPKR